MSVDCFWGPLQDLCLALLIHTQKLLTGESNSILISHVLRILFSEETNAFFILWFMHTADLVSVIFPELQFPLSESAGKVGKPLLLYVLY